MTLINNNPVILVVDENYITKDLDNNISVQKLHINSPSQRPKLLEIIINSPTNEEYKLNQMEKGYVNKIKPYITKWK